MNAKEFIKALDELEAAKGISKESIIVALKEAMEKAFIKQLGISSNNSDLADAQVRVDIDAKKGTIDMYILKNVVSEVEDDFLEISLEDASKDGKEYQVGDVYEIPVSTDELTKLAAQNVKSVLRQKISEAEKQALYEAYSDKIGEMIQGVVEKFDERSTIVNIGRTSVYLPNSQKIPGESFRIGEQIRLYVVDVQSTTKGAQVVVSRSDAGFLKRLFEEEISEIYEGIVMIKDIAREAGERSKIAVISDNPNVDPIGACIGPNGSRIQKICASLGNTKEKEKIDIIAYHENPGLYIMEALKPASVLGVVLYEEEKRAIAVVRNNELSLAIGKRGVNARLAVRITGWNIDIKEQDEALSMGLVYMTADDLKRQEELARMKKVEDLFDEDYEEVVGEEPLDDYKADEDEEVVVREEVIEDEVIEEEKEETQVVEEVKKEEPVVETTAVHTKVKLADLEKELEDEKKRRERQAQYASRRKKSYRDEQPSNDDSQVEPETKVTDRSTYMSIYTDEELEELDREEQDVEEYEEEEIDYDEFDSYYDDDNR